MPSLSQLAVSAVWKTAAPRSSNTHQPRPATARHVMLPAISGSILFTLRIKFRRYDLIQEFNGQE
jgi:hypothetical protein